MSRKRTEDRDHVTIRLRPDVNEALKVAAAERDVSVNWLINRAITEFLPRLIPASEFTLIGERQS